MDKLSELKAMVAHMEDDAKKFYAGNSAAGTRLRKQLTNVKRKCQEWRNDVQDIRMERKTKKPD